MSASPQFQVDHEQLRTHARTVGDLAGQLSNVAGSQPAGPADHSLGTFVQFLTAGLQQATASTTDSITHASSAVDTVSTGLTQTAQRYQDTDEQSAARLRAEGPR